MRRATSTKTAWPATVLAAVVDRLEAVQGQAASRPAGSTRPATEQHDPAPTRLASPVRASVCAGLGQPPACRCSAICSAWISRMRRLIARAKARPGFHHDAELQTVGVQEQRDEQAPVREHHRQHRQKRRALPAQVPQCGTVTAREHQHRRRRHQHAVAPADVISDQVSAPRPPDAPMPTPRPADSALRAARRSRLEPQGCVPGQLQKLRPNRTPEQDPQAGCRRIRHLDGQGPVRETDNGRHGR